MWYETWGNKRGTMNNYKFEFFTLTSFYILSSLKVFVGNNLLLLLLLLLKKKNISLSAQNGRILQKNLNSQWMMLSLRSIPLVSIYIIYINIDNFVRTNFAQTSKRSNFSTTRKMPALFFINEFSSPFCESNGVYERGEENRNAFSSRRKCRSQQLS